MTFKQMILSECTSRGMSEAQAIRVFGLVEQEQVTMRSRWDDDVSAYHWTIAASLRHTARRNALVWIDDNAPLAPFRPMFVD